MSNDDPQMKIRLPEDVKAFVEKAASIGARSQNSVIVEALRCRMGAPMPKVRITRDTLVNGDPIEGVAVLSKEDEQVIFDAITGAAAMPANAGADAAPGDVDEEPDWDRMTAEERRSEACHRLWMVSRQGPAEPPAFGLGTLAMLLSKDISYEGVFTPSERLAVATMATRYANAARQMALASADLEEADLA